MKNIIKFIIALAAAVVVFSCSLEERPEYFANHQNFYKTQAQCRSAVSSCYIPLKSLYVNTLITITEAHSDIIYTTQETADAALDVTPAKPQYSTRLWEYAYRGIMYCNEAIHCIRNTDAVDDAIKMPMVAEAIVLRGLYYYNLTSLLNGVPYYTCRVDTYAVQDSIRYLPRTDADVIRRNVYNDIRDNALPFFTAENRLKCRASDAPENRAGYALGLMLMAKCAMWNQDWDDALVALNLLEEIYGELTETNYPLFDIMWRYKNTDESIFEVQHDWSESGVRDAGNVAAIMTPSHSGDGIFNGVPLQGYGNTMPGWSSTRTNTRYAYCSFEQEAGKSIAAAAASKNCIFYPLPFVPDEENYSTSSSGKKTFKNKLDLEGLKNLDAPRSTFFNAPVDRRVIVKLGLGGHDKDFNYDGTIFNLCRDSKRCWTGPQFWCPDLNNNNDSNNYKIFRYADAVLMKAECLLNKGDSSGAIEYINKTRRRAGISEITVFNGFEDLMVELQNERARELGGEFQRRFDLVRWGIWYEQTYAATGNSELKGNMRPFHRYYPIPDKECALSNYILTNPEYDEGYKNE